MADATTVRLEIAERIATITIDRPDRNNALDRDTTRALKTTFEDLAVRSDVAALIVTGAGSKVFVAGADLFQMDVWRRDDGLAAVSSSMFSELERFPKPTIAAVNGVAVGGGCELALACDLRVAAAHARFGQPEVNLGVIPAGGGTQRLPRVIGLGRAKEMILTGDSIDAPTALAWGLVSAVVPEIELLTVARRLAHRILTRSPLAVRLAKLALNASCRVDVDSGLLLETLAQAICFESHDKAEGVRAFLEKRSPRFRSSDDD